MSPLQIQILLHYHIHPTDFRDGDFSAPAVREAIAMFCDEGMLCLSDSQNAVYEATKGVNVYVNKLMSIELPTLKWSY